MSYNIPIELNGPSFIVSNPVNVSFVGLSLETSALGYFLGNVSHPNVFFKNLLMQLGHSSNKQLTIRIGGDTQDSTWYDANLSTDIIVERNLKLVPNEWVTLGPLAFDHLRTLSSTMPINWIIGLNFNTSSVANPDNALAMAAAADSSLGDQINAFEIGNEPDNFITVKQRPTGWNMSDYVQEWAPFARKLQQTVSSARHQGIEAAVFGGGGWRISDLLNYTIDGNTFLETFQSSIKGISKHQYQTSNCNPLNPPVLQNLLNHSSIEHNVKYAVSGLSPMALSTYSFRLGEFNSVSCQGSDGLSNSFASALWAIDYMMLLAYYNVTACNIHNRFPSYYNVADRVDGIWKAQPVWYALLFVSQALGDVKGNGVTITSLETGDPDMPAYGLYNQAVLASIVVINLKQPSSENSDQVIAFTVDISKSQVSAQPLYVSSLVTKSSGSQSVISWANRTMEGSTDGTIQGKEYATVLQPNVSSSSITYKFAVPAFSAHLLEYRKSVVKQGLSSSGSSGHVETVTWNILMLTLLIYHLR